jgi:hypothetical protein
VVARAALAGGGVAAEGREAAAGRGEEEESPEPPESPESSTAKYDDGSIDDDAGLGEAFAEETAAARAIVGAAETAPVEYPRLSLEDTIAEFCDYLLFVFDPAATVFPRGTVRYHIKEDAEPHRVYVFGFTVDASGSLQIACEEEEEEEEEEEGVDESGADLAMRMAAEEETTSENDPAVSNDLVSQALPEHDGNAAATTTTTTTSTSVDEPSAAPLLRYPRTARHSNQRKYVRVLPWTKNHANISGSKYDIRMNETEFRDVFSGNVSVSQLTNSILSGRIYVSPWHMQSVYNFASSFRFDQWVEYYEDLAARRAEVHAYQQVQLEARMHALVESTISQAIAEARFEEEEKKKKKRKEEEEKEEQGENGGLMQAQQEEEEEEEEGGAAVMMQEEEAEAVSGGTGTMTNAATSGSSKPARGEDGALLLSLPAAALLLDGDIPLPSLSAPVITMLAGSFANSVEALLMPPFFLRLYCGRTFANAGGRTL